MAEASNRHQSTPVADDWNWTARVRNEHDASKAWQRNWGFLVDHQTPPGEQGATAAAPAGTSSDALAAFMQQAGKPGSTGSVVSMSYIAAKQRDSARARRLEQQDSLDGFVNTYMAKADPRARQLPAKEFRKPLTTSHDYGWGRNLERFGKMSLVMK